MDENLVAGSVSSAGDINISIHNIRTNESSTVTLAPKFEKDDHDNPALIQLPDGRIAAFFTKHTGPDMFMSTSVTPGNLTSWTTPTKINPNNPSYSGPKGAINSYTYPNPQILSREKNRLYLFWRGMNWKPTFSYSEDSGKSWSTGKIIVSPTGDPTSNRPYVKVAGDGVSTIHIAFTDGHPRNESTNSIYYVQYKNGAFRSINGQRIADFDSLPFRPDQADVAYDGKTEGIRSWIWDIAADKKGNPVITYSRMPTETEHHYRYASWNGKRWVDRPITSGGKWFPQTPEGKTEPEPHYSAGVVLDANDPRFVYLSRPINGVFQVERWFTDDGGNSWSRITLSSGQNGNVRPVAIRGKRPTLNSPAALWMNLSKYVHYTDYKSSIQFTNEDRGPFSAKDPIRTANAVFNWVQNNPSRYPKWEWMLAPLFSGVIEYGIYTNNEAAIDWVRKEGQSNDYKMGPRKSMADDVAVGQAFLTLYELDKNPAQIRPVQQWIEHFTDMPHTRSLEWVNAVHNEEMAWCDALYMAPPTMAMLSRITGNPKYANRMNELWWKTSDYLYDPTEHLYFRDSRYFEPREANGQKVFWSRGNGWVLAGLARVLNNLPRNFVGRQKLEKQFVEMATRLAALQTPDGTWHASLLDPGSYPHPETSGTGFFTYAMAWGVNNGLLERKKFEPVIQKGFASLTQSVDPNGKLGWVQPVGQDPKAVKQSDTDTYGVGAFLLAACEVDKLNKK